MKMASWSAQFEKTFCTPQDGEATEVEHSYHYQIKRSSLAAAVLAVSHDETRPYICGVAIQPAPDGLGAYVLATDGAVMIIIYEERGGRPVPEKEGMPPAIMVSPTVLNRLDKLTKQNADNFLTIGKSSSAAHWSIQPDGIEFIPMTVDFPDWRRALPRGSGAIRNGQSFSMAYLGLLAKAGKILNGLHNYSPRTVTYGTADNARGPAWVPLGENAVAALMPVYDVAETFDPPAWLAVPPKKE
jgi:hypothetical protein